MIQISSLSKSFGSRILLDNVDLKINPHEKVGLVGRNGHGKTTLIKIILGQEHQDSGSIEIPRNYRLGYVEQNIKFDKQTVLQTVSSALPSHESEDIWKCEKILTGLGFSEADFHKSPEIFSGGYQVRINLAKVLVSGSNLLLLDEPTNYLDIVSIRWLINFLKNWNDELLLITHDRSFMDSVVTHIAAIHRMKIRKIQGDTEKAYSQIIKEEEIYEKTRINDDKKRKEVELYINRFRAKANLAKMVQSRVKMLERMDKRDKLANIENLEFSFKYADIPAKTVLTAENLSFGYSSDNILIKNFSVNIGKGDRVCIIGKNGKGKTTLLNLLSGKLTPSGGEINMHAKCEPAVFSQTNVATLEPNRTVLEEIETEAGLADRQLARNICGSMMFSGDDALKKVSVLSGGEKARVMLGKILVSPKNILFLDEPTNHLDMDSCDSLLEAIDAFDGAVVLVTHNEMFLNAIAGRLIVFKDEKIEIFNGTYSEFLDKIGWDEEGSDGPRERNSLKPDKKELRKLKADLNLKKSNILKPIQNKISELESKIMADEERLLSIQKELLAAAGNAKGSEIEKLSMEHHQYEKKIESYYAELEEATMIFEQKDGEFKLALEELESLE
ncbi:MAG: ABC-F family ATP-binding cassette domain-containing protein [Spirochaetes bacterium]|nr:ABC-F family ATP-binding cassette domain-containing protein [Spirochaetota bacterium]